ncbi:MAG: AAA family ATPase [Eggerthellaceae bacterium]|nr:AAA family ATPase [Eggerthellaceae bacterium]
MQTNPFTPVFGKVPLHLVGRSQVIEDVTHALESHGNDPSLVSLFTGARGMGKTALLSALANYAEEQGWITARVTAAPGMLEEILLRVDRAASHLAKQPAKRKITGMGIASIVSLEWKNVETSHANWRIKMEDIFDALDPSETGVLITVDEVVSDLDEMTTLMTAVQHFLDENRKVALLMAGLPSELSALLSGRTTSFARRAARYELGPIEDNDVETALRETLASGGIHLDESGLPYAVRSIGGFPYMLQLVGYRLWNLAADKKEASSADVRNAVSQAQHELETGVYEATYYDLTEADRAFLRAMLDDNTASRQAELGERLGKQSGHVSKYKKRLVQQGVIEERPRGVLKFCLPGFKEYFAKQESELL